MTAPMPETMSPREKVARAVYDTVTRFDGDTVGTHLGLSAMIDAAALTVDDERSIVMSVCEDVADSVLTALASGSGDHAELVRLAEAATEGPWEWWSSCSHWRLTGADRRDGGVISATKASDGFPLVVCNEDDRAFIAAARSAVPALIAEVAALRESIGRHDQQVAGMLRARLAAEARATEAERALSEHRITADLLVSTLKADKAEAERKLAEAVGLNDRAAELMRQCTDPKRFEGASTLNVYANMMAWLSDLSKEAERG